MIAYRAKPVATITNKAAKIHRKGFRVNCSSRIKISEITDQLKVTSKYLAPATSLLGKMPHTYRLVHRSTALCARSSCQFAQPRVPTRGCLDESMKSGACDQVCENNVPWRRTQPRWHSR